MSFVGSMHMRLYYRKTAVIVLLFLVVMLRSSAAQDTSPVKIAFDDNSTRIDLITGKELPDYTLAKRGSVQFFWDRLDKPDNFVSYTHDGIRKAYIKDLRMIEKVQGRFAVWRLRYHSGNKNTPRIQHLAVSFIPLSKETNETQRRVYVLMNDMKLFDWGEKK